jgi:hypothetical protein
MCSQKKKRKDRKKLLRQKIYKKVERDIAGPCSEDSVVHNHEFAKMISHSVA